MEGQSHGTQYALMGFACAEQVRAEEEDARNLRRTVRSVRKMVATGTTTPMDWMGGGMAPERTKPKEKPLQDPIPPDILIEMTRTPVQLKLYF